MAERGGNQIESLSADQVQNEGNSFGQEDENTSKYLTTWIETKINFLKTSRSRVSAVLNEYDLASMGSLFVVYVLLSTYDTYADISLSYTAYSKNATIWASFLLAPVILNFVFVAGDWWRTEVSEVECASIMSLRCLKFCLLVFQLWPQYKVLTLLGLYCNKQNKEATRETEKYQLGLGNMEPYLEAILQTVIKLAIFCSVQRWDKLGSFDFFDQTIPTEKLFKIFGGNDKLGLNSMVLFYTSLVISLSGGACGLLKMLKVSPLRILPRGGLLGGFLTCSYVAYWLLIAKFLFMKGLLLGIMVADPSDQDISNVATWSALRGGLVFVATMMIPSLALSLAVLVKTLGGDTLSAIYRYPSLLLLPANIPLSFGPAERGRKSLSLNKRWSLANWGLHLCGVVALVAVKVSWSIQDTDTAVRDIWRYVASNGLDDSVDGTNLAIAGSAFCFCYFLLMFLLILIGQWNVRGVIDTSQPLDAWMLGTEVKEGEDADFCFHVYQLFSYLQFKIAMMRKKKQ